MFVAVFTPAQTTYIEGVNAPRFNSTKVNKAGVKAPLEKYSISAVYGKLCNTKANSHSIYYNIGPNNITTFSFEQCANCANLK